MGNDERDADAQDAEQEQLIAHPAQAEAAIEEGVRHLRADQEKQGAVHEKGGRLLEVHFGRAAVYDDPGDHQRQGQGIRAQDHGHADRLLGVRGRRHIRAVRGQGGSAGTRPGGRRSNHAEPTQLISLKSSSG